MRQKIIHPVSRSWEHNCVKVHFSEEWHKVFISIIILVALEVLGSYKGKYSKPMSVWSCDSIHPFPLSSHSISPWQENLPVYKRGLWAMCIYIHAFGILWWHSQLSVWARCPFSIWTPYKLCGQGLEIRNSGKVPCDGCNHPQCLTCYHRQLTHSAGNPALCRRNSKGHFTASWVTLIFFPC